ncbi:hypothetical protein C5167_042717 [Papaver somniferum]|uniref:Uncharacterized protein n=1 Tax=Papaver somniferum TaxID=3469 RepID=A0A4Y7L787_PAPSO|nr:hypothetical protein C5167_042717 [Papaver somniferum]
MGNSKVFMGILINFRKRYAQAFHGKLESTYGNPDKFPQGFDPEFVWGGIQGCNSRMNEIQNDE